MFWLNAFVSKNGISQTRSPRAIVTGHEIDYKHCELEFGEYVQTHKEHDNSMSPRTIGALALRPTGNAQGGYYFLSMSSGQRINWKSWTALPMPDEVIKQVHQLARRNGSKESLTFKDRNNHIIEDEDDDDDETYNPMDDYENNKDDNDDDPDSESDDDDDDKSDEDNDDESDEDDDDESDEGSATNESDEDDDNDNNDGDNEELENINEDVAPEVTDDDQSQAMNEDNIKKHK